MALSKTARKTLERRVPNSVLQEINEQSRQLYECVMKIKAMEEKELILLEQIQMMLSQHMQGNNNVAPQSQGQNSFGFSQAHFPGAYDRRPNEPWGAQDLLWPLWMQRRDRDSDHNHRSFDIDPDGRGPRNFGFRRRNNRNEYENVDYPRTEQRESPVRNEGGEGGGGSGGGN